MLKQQALFSAEIQGRPYVKKNTKRVFGNGAKKRVVYSPEFLRWQTRALFVLKQTLVGQGSILRGQLHASYTFCFKNRSGEADVSNLIEGIQDCLQTASVIENDKQIMSLDAQKLFNGLEKTVVTLYALEPLPDAQKTSEGTP
jgi:Holliday junction resolvase RusA-like endonuclease